MPEYVVGLKAKAFLPGLSGERLCKEKKRF
jgi:hypothetical protein